MSNIFHVMMVLPYALSNDALRLFTIHGANTDDTAPKDGTPVRLFGKWTGPEGVVARWRHYGRDDPNLPHMVGWSTDKGLFVHEPPLYWLPELDFRLLELDAKHEATCR